jgi:hypothetical protein
LVGESGGDSFSSSGIGASACKHGNTALFRRNHEGDSNNTAKSTHSSGGIVKTILRQGSSQMMRIWVSEFGHCEFMLLHQLQFGFNVQLLNM